MSRSTAKRILPRRTSAQIRRKNEEGRWKFKSRLHSHRHRHARSDNPSLIVRRRHHCVRHGPLARDARAHRVISPTSAPNTDRHAPNVGNSVEGSSENNTLAIKFGKCVRCVVVSLHLHTLISASIIELTPPPLSPSTYLLTA